MADKQTEGYMKLIRDDREKTSNSLSNGLLSCPFCGESAMLLMHAREDWSVRCPNCTAQIELHWDTKEEALKTWKPVEVERLVRCADCIHWQHQTPDGRLGLCQEDDVNEYILYDMANFQTPRGFGCTNGVKRA